MERDRELAKVDWARFDATTDQEIDRQIADDSDTAPVFSAEEFARLASKPDAVTRVLTSRR
jgi:hypothetical protein